MTGTKIRMLSVFEAEGEPEEMALFMTLFVHQVNLIREEREKRDIADQADELWKTIDEQMKRNMGKKPDAGPSG